MNKITVLNDAVKKVCEINSLDVIKDIRFVNIIDDIYDFNEIPGAKSIMRELWKDGYGEKILNINTDNSERQLKIYKLINTAIYSHGYDETIVRYIFNSIAYALNWTSNPPILHLNKRIVIKPNSILNLHAKMLDIKQEYEKYIETHIILTGLKPYFSANSLSQIFFMEEQIKILDKAMRSNEYEWCLKIKNKALYCYMNDNDNNTYSKSIITHDNTDVSDTSSPAHPIKKNFFKKLFGL